MILQKYLSALLFTLLCPVDKHFMTSLTPSPPSLYLDLSYCYSENACINCLLYWQI